MTPREAGLRGGARPGNQNARRETCRRYGHPLERGPGIRGCAACSRLRIRWRTVQRLLVRVLRDVEVHGWDELAARALPVYRQRLRTADRATVRRLHPRP